MKRLLNRIFSRMVMTCLLVALQVFVLIMGIWGLQSYYPYLSAGLTILSLLMVIYLITKDTNPDIKLAWIVPILSFPVLGGLMYLFYGHVLIPKRLKKNFLRVKEQECYEDIYGQNRCSSEELSEEPPYRLFHYVEEYGGAPIYKNTSVKYYAMGDDAWPDMLEDLRAAKNYIFMEYFIIDHGVMWDSVLEILKEKAAEGIDVRVMYDDIGSVFNVSKYYWRELESYGIKCIAFNQVVPFLATIFNNRDHRKITAIDGKVAYTGGFNLADEYINKASPYGVWKDDGVRLEGEAAWGFTVMFLQMWNSVRYVEGSYLNYKPKEDFSQYSDGYIQPYKTNPLVKEVLGENIYMQMINDARDYIYIFTPYLIVTNELMTAMKLSAKRGVDVRIVTPAIPDKKFIFRMTQTSYRELIEAGVRIYQYTPGFIHSKCLLADDKLASIGSINMDNRSFYHHFECGTLIYKSKAIADIKKDMLDTFETSEEIDANWCKKHLSRMTFIDAILRLLSPLL
ncbi:MAG: cardiolipin synthase [Coprococcus sp.]